MRAQTKSDLGYVIVEKGEHVGTALRNHQGGPYKTMLEAFEDAKRLKLKKSQFHVWQICANRIGAGR